MTDNLKSIRAQSIGIAAKMDVTVSPSLPLLERDLELRDAKMIGDRFLCIHVSAAVAYGLSKEDARHWTEREGLVNALSNAEKQFMLNGHGQPHEFQVQIEGMWATFWTMGRIDRLDFRNQCSPNFAAMLPNLRTGESSLQFRSRIALRRVKDVVAACDLAYCLHWAIRESQLHRTSAPQGLRPYVVEARRRALEWELGDDEWDDISLDT